MHEKGSNHQLLKRNSCNLIKKYIYQHSPVSCVEAAKALKTRVLPIPPANAIGNFGGYLGVFRGWHRAVARRCGYGEMTADFPVRMLCEHPDALIRMTEFVANLED